MNANELADLLIKPSSTHGAFCYEAATMLRQQQAEIEALKSRKLTDEEILAISNENYIENKGGDIDFARAILRKASEK